MPQTKGYHSRVSFSLALHNFTFHFHSKKCQPSTTASSTDVSPASRGSAAAASSISSSPTHARDIKKGSVNRFATKYWWCRLFCQKFCLYDAVVLFLFLLHSKEQQTWCESCNKVTRQIVCTHWVNCNDWTKPNKCKKYEIFTCLVCYAEYSGCRECKKKKDSAKGAACMYKWIKDESAATRFSLTCQVDGCKQKYIRCNYCKVTINHLFEEHLRSNNHLFVLLRLSGFVQEIFKMPGSHQRQLFVFASYQNVKVESKMFSLSKNQVQRS